jgi:hypothetical protein
MLQLPVGLHLDLPYSQVYDPADFTIAIFAK